MTRAFGIDASTFQGAIDWHRVAAAGAQFAFVRATIGSHGKDDRFAGDVAGARAAGLLVGAYHAMTSHDDPTFQATLFAKVVAPLGPFDLPPVVDFEVPDPDTWAASHVDAVDLCGRALTLANEIGRRALVDPLIYTGAYFGRCLPDCAARAGLGRLGLWVAQYSEGAVDRPNEAHAPAVPPAWPDWLFWQFSGDAGKHIDGIAGPVDHVVFNGTIDDLRIAFPKTEFAT